MKETEQQFIYAIQKGEIIVVKEFLKENPELSQTMTEQGISVLLLVAYMRNQELVNILLQHRTDLTIYEAVATGQRDVFQNQINTHPKQLNTYSSDGFTLVGLASFFGKKEIVKMLLERNADVNIPSNNNFRVTPLHSAAAVGEYEIAQLLLTKGAKINAVQMNGVTPLHSAANNGDKALVTLFLENGADKNLRMNDGKLPIDLAKEKNYHEVVLLLD